MRKTAIEKEQLLQSVTGAYTIYEALNNGEKELMPPEDFLNQFCENRIAFQMLVMAESFDKKLEFDNAKAKEALEKGYPKAEEILKDEHKLEKFLQRLEGKLKAVPEIGEKLSYLPILISIVYAHVKKEYTLMPYSSLVAIISALLYVISPLDIIPDITPGFGYLDDAAIVLFCWNLIESDAEEFVAWRDKNGKKYI